MLKLFSQLRSFTEVFGELKHFDFSNASYDNHATILRTNWSSFRESLERRLEEQDTSNKPSIFIRGVQKNLTLFSNNIFWLFKENETSDYSSLLKIMELFREIGTETTEILEYLQNNYSEYFDRTADISLWKIFTNKEAYTQSNQILWILRQRNIDCDLIEIVAEHLGILYDPINPKIKDWCQFNYMSFLANQLYAFTQSSKEGDCTLKLIRLLIGYDFNPLSFYEFMLEYSARVAGPDMPFEDQEMELISLLKTIENIRPECKHGYNKEVPPIGQSVSGSIRRDLKIIERRKVVHFPNYQNSKMGNFSNFYFEIGTTLEEMFFLSRVMLEVHLIKTKFKSNLYAFIERHIRTARTKKPSQQYMRNIFGPNKEVPGRVVKKIRLWLVMMLNYIDTNFKDQLKVWPFGLLAISFREDLINLFL